MPNTTDQVTSDDLYHLWSFLDKNFRPTATTDLAEVARRARLRQWALDTATRREDCGR